MDPARALFIQKLFGLLETTHVAINALPKSIDYEGGPLEDMMAGYPEPPKQSDAVVAKHLKTLSDALLAPEVLEDLRKYELFDSDDYDNLPWFIMSFCKRVIQLNNGPKAMGVLVDLALKLDEAEGSGKATARQAIIRVTGMRDRADLAVPLVSGTGVDPSAGIVGAIECGFFETAKAIGDAAGTTACSLDKIIGAISSSEKVPAEFVTWALGLNDPALAQVKAKVDFVTNAAGTNAGVLDALLENGFDADLTEAIHKAVEKGPVACTQILIQKKNANVRAVKDDREPISHTLGRKINDAKDLVRMLVAADHTVVTYQYKMYTYQATMLHQAIRNGYSAENVQFLLDNGFGAVVGAFDSGNDKNLFFFFLSLLKIFY